jgi:SWI/SNF-related matrix-associated actin-dependent regulator 1 of chromatin subfamily A
VATRELAAACEAVIGLSGTPIKNCPYEFFSILNMLSPDTFPSLEDYAFEFCNPRIGFRGQWDFRGASSLDTLHARVKPFMLRRTKKEVLKELPQTTVTHIPVKPNLTEYREARDNFIAWLVASRLSPMKVARAKRAEKIVQLGALKRLAGRSKLPVVKEWIKDWLDDNPGQKLVVFGIHKAVIGELREAFPASVVVNGNVTGPARQAAVERFQTDPSVRVFFGNLQAAGEGITLVASSTVLHTELSWNPFDHDQANDRVNRIGQTAGHIDAYYLIAKGTIEETLVTLQDNKRDVVSQVVDGKPASSLQDLLIESLFSEKEQDGKRRRKRPGNAGPHQGAAGQGAVGEARQGVRRRGERVPR